MKLHPKFWYLFYCFIQIVNRLRVFRCIDEQYPSTRSRRIFRLKRGFTCENFRFEIFGFVTWDKYATTSDHNKKIHGEEAKVGKYFVFLVRSLSLFSTILPSRPI